MHDPKEMPEVLSEQREEMDRLKSAGVSFTAEELKVYLEASPVVVLAEGEAIPAGYKKCGKCKQVKKFALFNRNSGSRLNCTGNCKECQKKAASVSYDKNKGKRDYKAYYQEHKELKREHGRRYYAEHKEEITAKQRAYRNTESGRKALNKAHAKRKETMKDSVGIPYTREMVIARDTIDGDFPICCLCGLPVTDLNDLHMEHLMPIALGGADCFTNVGCAHSICNLTKSKDAREITVEQVDALIKRSEEYINNHPEEFPDF